MILMNTARVDLLDRTLVQLLAVDGRTPMAVLGRTTGLSTNGVVQRVRRLATHGVIKGYRAVVDYASVGLPMTAFIEVRAFDPVHSPESIAAAAACPEIESCWSVAGDASAILKARVASPAHLEELLSRIRVAANVSTRSTIVLSTTFEDRLVVGPELSLEPHSETSTG